MSQNSLFRRNLLIIAGLHVLVLLGLYFSGVFSKHGDTVAWLDGGGTPAAPSSKQDTSPDETPPEETPVPSPAKTPGVIQVTAPSDIVLATPTPRATPRITPTPTPRPVETPTPPPKTPTPAPKPSVTPKPKITPSPTPKKKPSPSPKPGPKKSASPKPSAKASASPTASAKPKSSPDENGADSTGTDTGEQHTAVAGAGANGGSKGSTGTKPGTGGGDRGGNGKKGGSKEGAAQIGWYLTMIQDKFTARWQRPSLDEGLSAIVKIRVEKDGRISDVTLAKSSGNAIMDESVMSAAKSVTQIDPLPAAIEDSFFIVPIEFKLTSN